MNLREIGFQYVNSIHLVQDRDRWRESCKHRNESSGSITGG
jgi:hypothetical protein